MKAQILHTSNVDYQQALSNFQSISIENGSTATFYEEYQKALAINGNAIFELDRHDQFHYDFTNTTGKGRLVLDFDFANPKTNLTVTYANDNLFTGTFAFNNANLKVGTDTSISQDTQNLVSKAKLRVGTNSTLTVLNNRQAGTLISFGGDLTLQSGSTIDFSQGITNEGGDFIGHTSGTSINAIDMNNNALHILSSNPDQHINFVVDLANLDLSSGIKGENFTGSILDLLHRDADTPILNLVTNLNSASDLTTLANQITLQSKGGDRVKVFDFYQKHNEDEDPELVAKVTAGTKIVANGNALAIGTGITAIELVDNATLHIDPSLSQASPGQTDVTFNAKLVGGEDNILWITNDMGYAIHHLDLIDDGREFKGSVLINDNACVHIRHNLALAGSKEVRLNNARLTLEKTDSPILLSNLIADPNSNVSLKENARIEIHGNATFDKESRLLSSHASSRFALKDKANATIDSMNVLESYKGGFTLGADSNLTVTLDRDTTWTHTLEKLDPMQNELGTLRTTNSGALTFKNGFNNRNFRLDAQNAGGVFTHDATLGALTTQTHHTVDGMLTIANDFVANEGNRFALTVKTGVKQDEEIDNVAHWALGRNGNSGIRVNGKASGTVNLAITTKGSSQEERIAIFAANQLDAEKLDVQ